MGNDLKENAEYERKLEDDELDIAIYARSLEEGDNITVTCDLLCAMEQAVSVLNLQKAEIERLTEEKDKYQEKWQTAYMNELNLQKQVDELKELNEKYLDSIESLTVGKCVLRCELTKQAVKDTAKEILRTLIEKAYVNECIDLTVAEVKAWFREDYGVEV